MLEAQNTTRNEYMRVYSKTEKRKAYMRVYKPEWKKARATLRKSLLIEFLGGCCYQCGYSGCASAFDFHHRDPDDKIKAVSKLFDGRVERLIEEACKCVLLCARCHRELHEREDTLSTLKNRK